jgi:hypothetical protein
MPELPVTYRTRPMKMVLLLVGSGIFVGSGFWLLPQEPFVAYGRIIFFGLGVLVGLVGLLPNSSYLTLTDRGFEFASLYRKHFVLWSDVESFLPVKIQSKGMVGWNYSPGFSRARRFRSFNRTIAGAEAALPDTYGMSVKELTDLMNQLRDIHANAATRGPAEATWQDTIRQ